MCIQHLVMLSLCLRHARTSSIRETELGFVAEYPKARLGPLAEGRYEGEKDCRSFVRMISRFFLSMRQVRYKYLPPPRCCTKSLSPLRLVRQTFFSSIHHTITNINYFQSKNEVDDLLPHHSCEPLGHCKGHTSPSRTQTMRRPRILHKPLRLHIHRRW